MSSTCQGCTSWCPVQVKVSDGRAIKLRGNPYSKATHGTICPRPHLALQQLYDPDRIKMPMKRTNPKKGRDEDPGFVPISWDEAMETLADRMMAYDDYGRFDLENDPELWWVEFTRKQPSRLTPRLRSWYDRNPTLKPELDVHEDHARALASAVAAREENDALGYIS